MTDHEAIQELAARYADAGTRRDWEALAAMFTPGGVWDVQGRMPMDYDGDEVVPGIRRAVAMAAFVAQMISLPVVAIEGDRATSRARMLEVREVPSLGLRFEQFGFDEDGHVKIDGKWLFRQLRSTTFNNHKLPLEAARA